MLSPVSRALDRYGMIQQEQGGGGSPVHIVDVTTEEAYRPADANQTALPLVELGGAGL